MKYHEAIISHQKGQYEFAEKCYLAILQENPNHPDTLHLLGCLKKQQNQFFQAIQLIEKAIDITPQIAMYHYNLGLAYFELSEIEQAIASWNKTLELDPKFMDSYANIGYAYIELREFQKALEILLLGHKKDPQNQLILLNLATAYNQNESFEKARHYYEKLLSINANHIQALKAYGHLLYKTGSLVEAINCLLYLTDIQPDCVDSWYHLGCAYQDNCQNQDAVKCFKQVLLLNPNAIEVYYNLGKIETAEGQLTSAKKYFQAALDQNPNFSEVFWVLGNLCLAVTDFDSAQLYFQKALKGNKDKFLIFGSIHLYGLNLIPNIPRFLIYEQHLKWGNEMIVNCDYIFSHSFKKQRGRIRVGYVSADFREHSVAYFILPVFKHHNHNQFKIFLYANITRIDHMTEKIRQHCHVFRNIRGMSTKSAAKLIFEDQLDILVDLSGHMIHNRLDIFAMKPAPVQITYLGYPGTTGLKTMDYRLTDTIADPVNNAFYYTEQLIRINPPFICYQPPDDAPEVSNLPMIVNGYITFGSFNYLGKINNYVIQLWATLLKQIPDARLILKSHPLHDSMVCKRFHEMFVSKGISKNRLDFRRSVSGLNEHLRQYQDIDIALDPFPYNGTTTTCEALWMGVPVLTITGNYHSERVGTVLMRSIGLNDWIAADNVQFIKKACLFAKHPQLLARVRQHLRPIMRVSDLCNGKLHTHKLESVYKKVCCRKTEQKNELFC